MLSPDTLPNAIEQALRSIRVVLVNTTLPANIGSAARAMHTMGLSELTLVAPKHPVDETSIAHAAGGNDILARANTVLHLDEAIADCQLVFAASSRTRHLPRPVLSPSAAVQLMWQFLQAQPNPSPSGQNSYHKIALVFGREDRGLTNEELARADYHIQITANPAYPVLNVAAALQVIASFIYDGFVQQAAQSPQHREKQAAGCPEHDTSSLLLHVRQQWDEPAITHRQYQQLNQRILQLMIEKNLADPTELKALPHRLSRLSSRLQLDQKEYQLLNALLAKLLLN